MFGCDRNRDEMRWRHGQQAADQDLHPQYTAAHPRGSIFLSSENTSTFARSKKYEIKVLHGTHFFLHVIDRLMWTLPSLVLIKYFSDKRRKVEIRIRDDVPRDPANERMPFPILRLKKKKYFLRLMATYKRHFFFLPLSFHFLKTFQPNRHFLIS